MCAECDEGVGVILKCAWCPRLFVVCEHCYSPRRRYCSDKCEAAVREDQIRRARRTYARSRKGMIGRSHINQRFRLRRANKSTQIETDQDSTHHSDREIQAPDVERAPPGSDVGAMEGPCHDVHLEVCDPSGAAASADAGERAAWRRCAQGAPIVQAVPPARAADVAGGLGPVERPSLEHCRFCGAIVRWMVDRDHLWRRALARRKSAGPVRKRRPRQPRGPSGPGRFSRAAGR